MSESLPAELATELAARSPTAESMWSMENYRRDNVITACAGWAADTYPTNCKGVAEGYDYLVYLQKNISQAEQYGHPYFCVHETQFFAFARHRETKAWASITKVAAFRNELSARARETFFEGDRESEFETFWKRNGSSLPGNFSLICLDGGSELFMVAANMLKDTNWVKSQLEPALDTDRTEHRVSYNDFKHLWVSEADQSSPFVLRDWSLKREQRDRERKESERTEIVERKQSCEAEVCGCDSQE
jgi:hypothetical protein